MANFGSSRVAIPDKYYRDNERLLEGGIWAEVTVAHNDVDEDDYAFYVEDLRPIQLSKFDFEASMFPGAFKSSQLHLGRRPTDLSLRRYRSSV